MSNFLDQAGLSYLWTKILAAIESHSVTLPDKLVSYKAAMAITATEKLNADTLGGYSATYFAKSADVSTIQETIRTQASEILKAQQAVSSMGSTVSSLATNKASSVHAAQHAAGGSDPITPESIGAVGYNTAQSLTDAQQAQARENINAAPGGFGFGGEPIKTVSATSKDETYESFCARLDVVMSEMPKNSVKLMHICPPQIYGKASSTCSIVYQHTDGYCGVYNIGMPDPTCSQWRMIKVAGVWQPFEWINPPMELDTEYRTTERYLGNPVYTKIKQFDNLSTSQAYSPGGSIIRFSGESQWPYDNSGKWVPQIVSQLPDEELKGDLPHIDFCASYNFTIRILLTANSKCLGKSARVQMWYTK